MPQDIAQRIPLDQLAQTTDQALLIESLQSYYELLDLYIQLAVPKEQQLWLQKKLETLAQQLHRAGVVKDSTTGAYTAPAAAEVQLALAEAVQLVQQMYDRLGRGNTAEVERRMDIMMQRIEQGQVRLEPTPSGREPMAMRFPKPSKGPL